MKFLRSFPLLLLVAALVVPACSKKETATGNASAAHDRSAHQHEHKAPHDGTPVVLGNESYHLELVLDPAAGKLSAYVLDGEMEKYIRLTTPSFEIIATVAGVRQPPLVFKAVADSATGEKVGDSALFEATAEWLKAAKTFDGTIPSLEIRGTTFSNVAFNFPKGNDKD